MPSPVQHQKVQSIAKEVMHELGQSIVAKDTEESIARKAADFFAQRGINTTWYYDCIALVLLGSRSCNSLSGRDYIASDEQVGETNLITIDLSPVLDGTWGDYARSFYVESGQVVEEPEILEFQQGQQTLLELHQAMQKFVSHKTTFADLYHFANEQIEAKGFENLDFLGNLGHTIEVSLDDRKYIVPENKIKLADVNLFTFEPHIRKTNGRWGFKREDIYFVNTAGQVECL